MVDLGDRLLTICKDAINDVFLAAPFIKSDVIKRILGIIPDDVNLTVVVRFRPADIAARVTDFAIVDEVTKRPNTTLRAHPSLHAKIYRVDHRVLIGSANLTNSALGWCSTPNVETLVELQVNNDEISATEALIRQSSYELTPEIAEEIIKETPSQDHILDDIAEPALQPIWIPKCRRPDILWSVYLRGEAPDAKTSVVKAAQCDLDNLWIPPNLTQNSHNIIIKAVFQATPFYMALVQKLEGSGLSDDQGAKWLQDNFSGNMPDTPRDTWETVKQWLKEFGPDELHVEADSERTRMARRFQPSR